MRPSRDVVALRASLIWATLGFLAFVAILMVTDDDGGAGDDDAGVIVWSTLATCTPLVAAAWFAQAVKAGRERGLARSGARLAALAVAAPFAAALIVGFANLAFLAAFVVGYGIFAERATDVGPYHDPHGVALGVAFGLIVGATTGFALRAATLPTGKGEARPHLRRFGPLAALMLAALMCVGCELAALALGWGPSPPPLGPFIPGPEDR